jgi:hypothetical protein
LPVPACAGDEPFITPSNWGGTGLMEIPTARVLKEDSYRLGYSQIDPYRNYYGAVSPLKGLEVDLRITEVMGVPAFDPPNGNYRDKAFDVKYQFLSEGKYLPAVAIGIMDPHGTRIYPSQYIVVSKQIYPFDFTLGFGNGRFGENVLSEKDEGFKVEMFTDTDDWFSDSQFFGGIQFAPSEKFALMIEYSPIKYHKQTRDPAQEKYFDKPVPSEYNVGMRYKPTEWSELGVSYQRGEQVGFHVSIDFDIGNPLIPIFDPPYRENPAFRMHPMSERIARALHSTGFSDISVAEHGTELTIEAQNEKYYYRTSAIGAALYTVNEMLPEHIERINIVLIENGIVQIKYSALRSDMEELYAERLTVNEFNYLSNVTTDISERMGIKGLYKKRFRYGIKPSLETFLNDPSGFFKYRLGASVWAGYNPWDGSTFLSALEAYPLNDISTTNEPLSIPVRSDIVMYKEKDFALGRLLFDQIYKTGDEMYGKFSAGLLEVQYGGLDAEIARPFFDGRVLFGISGSAVKKRDPDNPFKFIDNGVKDIYTTAFFNARLNSPEYDISLDIKAGRFLAGDNGVRFTASKFINGVVLKAWYTVTDTSDFTDEHNDGYNDKGISISIPLRMFLGTDSRSVFHYSLTPWTRDTGQDIDHFGTLFDFIGRSTKIYIDRDSEMLFR